MNAPANPSIQSAVPRALAGEVLTEMLVRGRSLSACIAERDGAFDDPRDRAFARELCYGVTRWLPRLQACLDLLMERPLKDKDVAVRVALLLGLYQLMYTRVPEHAAVAESVEGVRRAGKPWATGLVNGVLRGFLRGRAALTAKLEDSVEGRLAHPAWLAGMSADAWPSDWERILGHNNERPPLGLRVNARRRTREAYLAELGEAGVAATPVAHAGQGVQLREARDVDAIPGFADGVVSVQDGAAQLAADLLGPQPGMRILDACAAPGGKSAHILETQPAIAELIAVDRDGDRLQRVRDNLARLDLDANLVAADAGEPNAWWDGGTFHRILLDAPCSGTGVIRRNPDIKVLRREADVDALAAGQARLLDALWPLLAPRGRLLYATCSYLPRENDHVLAGFLAKHPDAACGPMEYTWGRPTRHGRQVLPGEDAMDGFYYALLGKH
jgi:16S rRNA (cytosine967-C5)-methyltransferase